MSRCTLLAALLLLCARCAAGATLVFAHYYPPNRDAGSDQRLLNIIATAVRGGHSVYFVCPKAGRTADLQALEELIGRNRTLVLDKALRAPPPFPRRVTAFIAPVWFWFRPAVFERYAPFVRSLYPAALTVALSDDCHFVRQQLLNDTSSPRAPAWFLERERAIYCSADVVAFITELDAASCAANISALRERVVHGRSRMRVVRTGPQHRPRALSPLPGGRDADFVFLGKGNNPTNYIAIQRFLSFAWPHVLAALPSARLFLVGEACAEDRPCSWLHGTPYAPRAGGGAAAARLAGIHAVGFDERLESLAGRTAMVMPIFASTGVNTKFFRALEFGLPVVLSRASAASLNVSQHDGIALFLCDEEPGCWVERLVSLASDRLLRKRMGEAASALGAELYDQQVEARDTGALLEQVVEEQEEREKRFAAATQAAGGGSHTADLGSLVCPRL